MAVGATFSTLPTKVAVIAAFVVGFVETVSLWWLYFVREAEQGAETIAQATEPARIGRAAYAYAHGIMVAGVIVTAVAIDLTIVHPTGGTPAAAALAILGGPALYFAGNSLFNYSLVRKPPWSRLTGIGVLALLLLLASVVGELTLSALAALVTLALALLTGSPFGPASSVEGEGREDAGREGAATT